MCPTRFRAVVLVAASALAVVAPAHGQTQHNMTLLGSLDEYAQYSDIWGYADASGREYAILGTRNGTSIINVTDPANPYETGFIAGPSSPWRDMKTHGHHAYIVSEGGGGMQIVDLSDPEDPQALPAYTGFSRAHNLYIEEARARAYPCGTNQAQGFHVLDLSDPTQPVPLGSYDVSYVHDLYVRDDIAYIAEIDDRSFSILDVTSPLAPVRLAGPITYPGAFTHNTWLTPAGKLLLTSDETVGARVRVWDIASFLDISQVGSYQAPVATSIVHNVIVHGDRAYVSYYTEGVRVLDLADPTAPAEVAFYDTWPGPSGTFDGAWGVYPFLPSGHVLVSDIESGLFILSVDDTAKVSGTVTDSVTGALLADVHLELVEAGTSVTTSVSGAYTLTGQPGTDTLRATRAGYFDHEEAVTLQSCCVASVDIELEPRPSADLRGSVMGNAPAKSLRSLEEARIDLLDTPYTTTTAPDGSFLFTQIPIGPYTMRVIRAGFGSRDFAVDVVEGGSTQDVVLEGSPWYDDADQDRGWSLGQPNDTATDGLWIRAVPVPSGGGAVQPGVDATPDASAGLCFVTGNASSPDAFLGEADVDGGVTTLTTPTLDLSGLADPRLAYSRWYVNSAGANPGTDVFTVQISNDDGGTWTTLETVGFDATPWTRVVFRVEDYLPPTSGMKVRFLAEDAEPGSLVEVGVDDFEFWAGNGAATARREEPPASPAPALWAVPNPFNPTTRLAFELRERGRVRLTIHDLRGRRIAVLEEGPLEAGRHVVGWDGRDASGGTVASGVYLARLETPRGRSALKLTLAK